MTATAADVVVTGDAGYSPTQAADRDPRLVRNRDVLDSLWIAAVLTAGSYGLAFALGWIEIDQPAGSLRGRDELFVHLAGHPATPLQLPDRDAQHERVLPPVPSAGPVRQRGPQRLPRAGAAVRLDPLARRCRHTTGDTRGDALAAGLCRRDGVLHRGRDPDIGGRWLVRLRRQRHPRRHDPRPVPARQQEGRDMDRLVRRRHRRHLAVHLVRSRDRRPPVRVLPGRHRPGLPTVVGRHEATDRPLGASRS